MAKMSKELEGKVALVTGAARGLGAEIVRRMVAAGAQVTAADKRVDDGVAAAAEAGAHFVELDVTDAEQWAAAVDAAADGGRLDILVNNAAITRVVPILDCDPAEFRKVIDTNLVGTFSGHPGRRAHHGVERGRVDREPELTQCIRGHRGDAGLLHL